MQLFNQTPLDARVDVSEVTPQQPRIGILSAKATFRFDLEGGVELETQEPLPLLMADEPTPLGLLPSDFEARRDRVFEVILLGKAYAPMGRPIEGMSVELSVHDVRRQLVVSGDRAWAGGRDGSPEITRPTPFTSLPLVYERAFGGSQVAWIDAASEFDLTDPVNPHGRGFDAEYYARALGLALKAPAGFPRIDNYRRLLPNLEHPQQRIQRWQDAPEPICWATVPTDVPIHAARSARRMEGQDVSLLTKAPEGPKPWPLPDMNQALYRAHPDWVIPVPPTAPIVRLSGLTEEREYVAFRLLDQRVVADYVIQGRSGSRPLLPQRLVLLPDERRFTLLFRAAFTFNFDPADERAFRLRLDSGWFDGSPQP